MNERIKALAVQARNEWLPTTNFPDKYTGMHPELMEKFAELIVLECASMARVFQSNEYDFTGDLDLDEFMLKHFGVDQ